MMLGMKIHDFIVNIIYIHQVGQPLNAIWRVVIVVY